jgi:hypothetical protein
MRKIGVVVPAPRQTCQSNGAVRTWIQLDPRSMTFPATTENWFLLCLPRSTNSMCANRLVASRRFRRRRHRRGPGDFESCPDCAYRAGVRRHRLLPQSGDPPPERHAPCVRSRLRPRRSSHRREPPLHRKEGDRTLLLPVVIGPADAPARCRQRSRAVRRRVLPW